MEKKLCLSKKNKMIAGVCGGISEYFRIDVSLLRIIFVLCACILGSFLVPMILFYVICWAVMPLAD